MQPDGTSRRAPRPFRAGVLTSTLVLGALLGLAAPAAPAGAATAAAPGPHAGLCARVRTQYARLVIANGRLKAAYQKASALHDRLVRAGRTRLARRLDVRLAYLRDLHAALIDRVNLIAARAQRTCSIRPPVLANL